MSIYLPKQVFYYSPTSSLVIARAVPSPSSYTHPIICAYGEILLHEIARETLGTLGHCTVAQRSKEATKIEEREGHFHR